MKEINLNIGAGTDIKKGYINIDFKKAPGIDLVMDFNKDRLINHFKKDSVKNIYMSHILEHLINPYEVITDCHYILKKDGVLLVKLPATMRASLAHLRTGHTKGYFFCLRTNKRIKPIGLDSLEYFDIYVKGNIKYDLFEYIIQRYLNFRDWFYRQIYDEYVYTMRKK